MADFDGIIIGAGHNGLICASNLSRAGWRVAVVEGASQVGGGLRSDVFTVPGFVHDRYATNLSLFASSLAYRELKSDLDALGVSFLSADKPYASIHRDHAVRVFTDPGRTAESIATLSSRDAQGWLDLVEFYKRISPSVHPFFYTEMPSTAALARASEMVLGNHPADVWRFAALLRQSSTSFAKRYFQTPDVISVFQAWGYHLDFPPQKAGGALFAFISAMSAHVHGMRMAQGGAGRVSEGLRTLIERAGGLVLTNSEVSQIVVRRSRAVGVRTRDGKELTAGRAIVANVTTRNLFGKLVDPSDLPRGFLKRANGFCYGPGTFIIHLALNRVPDWKMGADLNEFGYVHLNVGEAEIHETYENSIIGKLPVRPLLVVSQTTHIDPSRAPHGKHVMRIHVRTVPGRITGDAGNEITARDWKDAKEPFMRRILDLVEEAAPDLRECIIGTAVETPQDIECENPNFVGGDCVSGSHHLAQNFFLRPFWGWSNYRTPVDGLFMIGASTWPGGGVNGASGYLVAQKLERMWANL
jgi:phytoene dehydrogenase-like protein